MLQADLYSNQLYLTKKKRACVSEKCGFQCTATESNRCHVLKDISKTNAFLDMSRVGINWNCHAERAGLNSWYRNERKLHRHRKFEKQKHILKWLAIFKSLWYVCAFQKWKCRLEGTPQKDRVFGGNICEHPVGSRYHFHVTLVESCVYF